MEDVITIMQMETAINVWRGCKPSDAATVTLCKPAAELAKCYAEMIVEGLRQIPVARLSSAQLAAYEQAIKVREATVA